MDVKGALAVVIGVVAAMTTLVSAAASRAPQCDPTCTRSIAVVDTGDGMTVLYAAHTDGVSTSSDGGRSWQPGGGLPGRWMEPWIVHVAVSTTRPKIVYAAGWNTAADLTEGRIVVSSDGGRRWRAVSAPRGRGVMVLVVDPRDPGTVYAGADNGLFKSTTGGDRWRKLDLPPGKVTGLAIERGRPSHLYAAVAPVGLFRSTDGGRTWRGAMTSSKYDEIATFGFDPLAPGTLYVGTGIGIYSSENGSSWRKVYGGPKGDGGHIHGIAFDPTNRGTMYAITYCEGIIKSRNHGRSWRAINRGFVPGCRSPYDIEVDPHNSRVLYVLTPDVGLFKSTDGGGHWVRTPQP